MPFIGQVEELKIGNQPGDLIQSPHYARVLRPDQIPDLITLLAIGHEQRKAQENNRWGGKIEPDTAPRDDEVKRYDAQGPDRAEADEAAGHKRGQRKQWQHRRIDNVCRLSLWIVDE